MMERANFRQNRSDDLDYLSLDFGPEGRARLCITTRRGGCSFNRGDLNLSFGTGDEDAHVKENRNRLASLLGTSSTGIAGMRQVHSATVQIVDADNWEKLCRFAVEGDGMITTLRDRWLSISVGDCLAITLLDPGKGIFAMLHAGWAGTAKRITEAAVERMSNAFGSDPGDLFAAIGPGIGLSAYEVDERVFREFDRSWNNWEQFVHDKRKGKGYLDIAGANQWLLSRCGVPEKQISLFGLCTHTLSSLFFSHRRDGYPGGRMLALGCMK